MRQGKETVKEHKSMFNICWFYFSFQKHFISHLLSTLRIKHNKKKQNQETTREFWKQSIKRRVINSIIKYERLARQKKINLKHFTDFLLF